MFSNLPKLSVGTSISTWRLISETKNEGEEGVHPCITESFRDISIFCTQIYVQKECMYTYEGVVFVLSQGIKEKKDL